ncbi:hypothetical protein ACJX0J_034128 [Zea mays]
MTILIETVVTCYKCLEGLLQEAVIRNFHFFIFYYIYYIDLLGSVKGKMLTETSTSMEFWDLHTHKTQYLLVLVNNLFVYMINISVYFIFFLNIYCLIRNLVYMFKKDADPEYSGSINVFLGKIDLIYMCHTMKLFTCMHFFLAILIHIGSNFCYFGSIIDTKLQTTFGPWDTVYVWFMFITVIFLFPICLSIYILSIVAALDRKESNRSAIHTCQKINLQQ